MLYVYCSVCTTSKRKKEKKKEKKKKKPGHMVNFGDLVGPETYN